MKKELNSIIIIVTCIIVIILLGVQINQSVQRMGYGLEDRGTEVLFPEGIDFSLLHSVQTDSDAHSASYPKAIVSISLGAKRQRQADRFPPSSAKVTNMWR
jgi:hypothetical protein